MSIKVYTIITEQIINRLKTGVAPWRMPWNKTGMTPFNPVTKNTYSGTNRVLLSMLGFTDPRFVTLKNANLKGGSIKKGEKGFPVIKWLVRPDPKNPGENIFSLMYFTVFNVTQTEGIVWDTLEKAEKPFAGIDAADAIAATYANGPKVSHGGDRAFYSKDKDSIGMPTKGQFENEGEYYSTLFHEYAHSTGHPSRLDRKELGSGCFGSQDYSLEELTAEICAAFLCHEAGIDGTLDNSASYIQGWLKKLGEDPKMFVQASAKAQKAANHILGIKEKVYQAESEAA